MRSITSTHFEGTNDYFPYTVVCTANSVRVVEHRENEDRVVNVFDSENGIQVGMVYAFVITYAKEPWQLIQVFDSAVAAFSK